MDFVAQLQGGKGNISKGRGSMGRQKAIQVCSPLYKRSGGGKGGGGGGGTDEFCSAPELRSSAKGLATERRVGERGESKEREQSNKRGDC